MGRSGYAVSVDGRSAVVLIDLALVLCFTRGCNTIRMATVSEDKADGRSDPNH